MQKKSDLLPILTSILKAVGYFAVWYFVSFGVSFILQAILRGVYSTDGPDTFAYRISSLSYGITLVSNLVVVFIFAIYYHFRGTGLFSQASLVKSKPVVLTNAITLGACCYFALNYIISLLSLLLPKAWVNLLNPLPMDGFEENQAVAFLSVCLIAPICEELVFRGLIAKTLSTAVPSWLAVGVSSLAFGIVHYNSGPIAVVYATLMGVLFGWLFFRTKSLVPCVFAHALFNAASFFADRIDASIFMIVTYVSFIVIFISIFNIIKATKEDKTDENL